MLGKNNISEDAQGNHIEITQQRDEKKNKRESQNKKVQRQRFKKNTLRKSNQWGLRMEVMSYGTLQISPMDIQGYPCYP